jgi:hypothetical protein
LSDADDLETVIHMARQILLGREYHMSVQTQCLALAKAVVLLADARPTFKPPHKMAVERRAGLEP